MVLSPIVGSFPHTGCALIGALSIFLVPVFEAFFYSFVPIYVAFSVKVISFLYFFLDGCADPTFCVPWLIRF